MASVPVAVPTLATLASGAYAESEVLDFGNPQPPDCWLEVDVTPSATPTGGKQVLVFAQASQDGSYYTSGPSSGVDATDEADLYFVGTLPVASAAVHRRMFSVADAMPGGRVPPYARLVLKNDCGVALSGGAVYRYHAIDTIA
jgi:hypothetical protein